MGERELNYRRFIRSLVSMADIASRLEVAQRDQTQSIEALIKGADVTKWYRRLGSEDDAHGGEEEKGRADLQRANERLANVGKVIESGLVKRIDVLLQRVSKKSALSQGPGPSNV